VIELASDLGPLEQIAVVHTHALEAAYALRRDSSHLFPSEGETLYAEVTPVIGAHIGPRAVGFVCVQAKP
jgi:fatty acid-binding protein DegV